MGFRRPSLCPEADRRTTKARAGRVGFKGGQLVKTDAFLAAHPFATVPAAFSPDGTTGIFESNSIMRAVARLRPQAVEALRQHAYEAARIDSFLDASLVFARDSCRSTCWPCATPTSPPTSMRGQPRPSRSMPRASTRPCNPTASFLVGETLSLADICFVAELCLFLNERHHRPTLARRGLTPILNEQWREQFPSASSHFNRLIAHPAFGAGCRPVSAEALRTSGVRR